MSRYACAAVVAIVACDRTSPPREVARASASASASAPAPAPASAPAPAPAPGPCPPLEVTLDGKAVKVAKGYARTYTSPPGVVEVIVFDQTTKTCVDVLKPAMGVAASEVSVSVDAESYNPWVAFDGAVVHTKTQLLTEPPYEKGQTIEICVRERVKLQGYGVHLKPLEITGLVRGLYCGVLKV